MTSHLEDLKEFLETLIIEDDFDFTDDPNGAIPIDGKGIWAIEGNTPYIISDYDGKTKVLELEGLDGIYYTLHVNYLKSINYYFYVKSGSRNGFIHRLFSYDDTSWMYKVEFSHDVADTKIRICSPTTYTTWVTGEIADDTWVKITITTTKNLVSVYVNDVIKITDFNFGDGVKGNNVEKILIKNHIGNNDFCYFDEFELTFSAFEVKSIIDKANVGKINGNYIFILDIEIYNYKPLIPRTTYMYSIKVFAQSEGLVEKLIEILVENIKKVTMGTAITGYTKPSNLSYIKLYPSGKVYREKRKKGAWQADIKIMMEWES